MVVYSKPVGGLFNIGCPFCLVTYQYPLLWVVIPAYAISIALVLWSYLLMRSSRGLGIEHESSPLVKKANFAAKVLAIIGTFLLLVQVGLGFF